MHKDLICGVPKLKRVAREKLGMCPGCGHPLVGRIICEVLEELGIQDRAIQGVGVGCTGHVSLTTNIDAANCTHGTVPAMLTGMKHALFDEPIVYGYQGDGDAGSIGAGALIGAAARAEKITLIMGNNANYGTTGGQAGPTSLLGQVTTTTPLGRDGARQGYPLHVAELLATIKGVAYSARGAVNNPANYQRTKGYVKIAFQKQIDGIGLGFVEILVTCPVNWHMTPLEALNWVENTMIPEFPLGEFKNVSVCG